MGGHAIDDERDVGGRDKIEQAGEQLDARQRRNGEIGQRRQKKEVKGGIIGAELAPQRPISPARLDFIVPGLEKIGVVV